MSEFLLRLKAAFRVSRGHDHLRAAGDERLCRRETDARSPAGDQRNLSQKILHTSCLLTSCYSASLSKEINICPFDQLRRFDSKSSHKPLRFADNCLRELTFLEID